LSQLVVHRGAVKCTTDGDAVVTRTWWNEDTIKADSRAINVFATQFSATPPARHRLISPDLSAQPPGVTKQRFFRFELRRRGEVTRQTVSQKSSYLWHTTPRFPFRFGLARASECQ